MRTALPLAVCLALCAASAHAQTRPAAPQPPTAAADSAAVRAAALDYIEGWYTGDAERMSRALHPDMAKRYVRTDDAGRQWLGSTTADGLTRQTRAGLGRDIPVERRWSRVEIQDLDGNLASVKLHSTRLVDYLHLARWDGGWRIVNVLWDFRPEDRPRP